MALSIQTDAHENDQATLLGYPFVSFDLFHSCSCMSLILTSGARVSGPLSHCIGLGFC